MDKENVLKLANLSRIKLSDEEAESLSREFESILSYVGEVKSIHSEEAAQKPEDFPVRNVMREDGEGHDSGIYTETLLKEAPSSEKGYVKVKKIISND